MENNTIDLTRLEYHELAKAILSIPGMNRNALKALLAGVSIDIRNRMQDITSCPDDSVRLLLILLLMSAVDYIHYRGWGEDRGEAPLVIILENALLFMSFNPSSSDLQTIGYLKQSRDAYQAKLNAMFLKPMGAKKI